MIESFARKGLENFFLYGSTKGIQVKHAARQELLLDRLDASANIKGMDFPGSGLHRLKGALREHWAVKVSGNWRLTFRFEGENAHVVNCQDYH
ncbi:MAG: type II toxin-antitoxin system RelE/ParE family toxin [Deltaproteobacteria bacterium]|nr:type II toxin-antitoxin system RelE/ParE family toxin [Deltaproteobacteria bacterium]